MTHRIEILIRFVFVLLVAVFVLYRNLTSHRTKEHYSCSVAVIEGVLEVTTVYEITLETRIRSRPATLCASCLASATQVSRS